MILMKLFQINFDVNAEGALSKTNYVKKESLSKEVVHRRNPVAKVMYMFKVNNRNNRTRCRICSKLTIKTLVGSLTFLIRNRSI